MASKLLERQFEFMQMLPRLIDYAHKLGYQVTIGDAYRDPRVFGAHGQSSNTPVAYGSHKSCHKLRLAIDLNLFKDGKMLTRSEDHEPLGLYWESLGGSWGGRFGDGNHYSLSWEGSK